MILYMPKYDAEFKTQNRQETCQTQKDEKQYSQNNKQKMQKNNEHTRIMYKMQFRYSFNAARIF